MWGCHDSQPVSMGIPSSHRKRPCSWLQHSWTVAHRNRLADAWIAWIQRPSHFASTYISCFNVNQGSCCLPSALSLFLYWSICTGKERRREKVRGKKKRGKKSVSPNPQSLNLLIHFLNAGKSLTWDGLGWSWEFRTQSRSTSWQTEILSCLSHYYHCLPRLAWSGICN